MSSPYVEDLCRFITAAPTPYHAVDAVARRLRASGFEAVDRSDAVGAANQAFMIFDGTIVAWRRPADPRPDVPLRVVGAHTDSPGFRIKPRPDVSSAGWRQLGVEVYGGPLVNSWLDRDLGVAGRVAIQGPGGVEVHLVRDDRALLRIPQLAIHLDRDINEKGLTLDRQRHLCPVWGLGATSPGAFKAHLATLAGVEGSDVLWWDIAPFDVDPARITGLDDEFLSAARLDNLVSCHAAISALCAADAGPHVQVVALFDHEEVGSTSATGAGGTLLATVVERICLAEGGDRGTFLTALAGSHGVSADMAHATHPNYPERHDPDHPIALNGGPVIKVNAQQRYATDAASVGPFIEACQRADVPFQKFVSNSSMPCGSTIGPSIAAQLAMGFVDVGVAQLAMHSVRELCGSHDPEALSQVFRHYLSGS